MWLARQVELVDMIDGQGQRFVLLHITVPDSSDIHYSCNLCGFVASFPPTIYEDTMILMSTY